MKLIKKLSLFLLFFLFFCSESEDRQELVDSIRGVGSEVFYKENQKPFWKIEELAALGNDDTLTVSSLILLPEGKEFDFSIYEDDKIQSGAFLNLSEDKFSNLKKEEIKKNDFLGTKLSLYKVSADFSGNSLLKELSSLSLSLSEKSELSSILKIRYGFKIVITNLTEKETSEGIKSEEILVGDIIIWDSNIALYDSYLTPPTLTLPNLDASYKRSEISSSEVKKDGVIKKIKQIPLKLEISEPNEATDETNPNKKDKRKLHWFVSGGEVENFRAKDTLWSIPEKNGTYLVLVGAYGLRSRLFEYKYKVIEIID